MPSPPSTPSVETITSQPPREGRVRRHRRRRVTTPRPISDAWEQALTGYELDSESRGLNPRSIANRRSAVTGLARWLEAEHGVVSPGEVAKAHLQLAMKKAHQERARSGVRSHYNDLKAFWSWWAEDEHVPSPLDGIRRPSDVIVPVQVLTAKEIAKILAAVSGRDWLSLRDHAIIMTLLETGMRRAELCALDVSDLDLKVRELTIRRGKGGRSRVVVFGPSTAAAVHRLLRRHPATDGPLFTSRTRRRLSECAVGAMLHRRGEQAGIRELAR